MQSRDEELNTVAPPTDADDDIALAPVLDAQGTITVDLFCLTCGYNLRGLSGDPARCPECGEHNDLGTAAIPAAFIAKALNGMETAPTMCVAAAVVFFVFAPLLMMPPGLVCAAVIVLLPPAAWCIACVRCQSVFESQPGWMRIVFDFHVATFLCTLAIPLCFLSHILLSRSRWDYPSSAFLIGFVLAIPPFLIGLRIYSAARSRLRIMQREAAVRIAREALRKQLHRGRRRG